MSQQVSADAGRTGRRAVCHAGGGRGDVRCRASGDGDHDAGRSRPRTPMQAQVPGTTITLVPEADAYVSGAAPETNFGGNDHFDTYGGSSARSHTRSKRRELVHGRRYSTPEGAIAQVSTCLNSCLTGV